MIRKGKELLKKAGYKRYGFEAYAKREVDGCFHEYSHLHHATSVLGVGPFAKGILSGHLQYQIDPVGNKMSEWTFSACRTDKRYAMARFLILHLLMGMSREEIAEHIEAGKPRAVGILRALIARLEEKRQDLGGTKSDRVRTAFRGLDLHPRIAAVATDLYLNGHHNEAVFNASKALVNLVKERAGRYDLDAGRDH